MSITSENDP